MRSSKPTSTRPVFAQTHATRRDLRSHGQGMVLANILSDIDAELAALETRRDKTRALKQAMMQELLTGKTRLV